MCTTSDLYPFWGAWQVMLHGGQYHLFFSCWKKFVSRPWARALMATQPWVAPDFTDSALWHLVSERIEGPFRVCARDGIVAGSGSTGLYGMTLVPRPDLAFDVFGGIVVVASYNPGRLTMELSDRFGFR